jgi:zinc/manganese transport system permease protein
MLAHEFVRNALIAGTPIALASGAIGYFVVLRAQVFAGDALSHVAFTGAVAAAAAGLDLRLGLFVATIAVALLLAALGERARADDTSIGVVFVWVLGLGVLCLDFLSGGNGTIAARTLFGSIFGLTAGGAWFAALVGIVVLSGVVVLARPLLFSTLDPAVAAARGVRVTAIGTAFLVLLALDAAEATQAVGALLLLGLIAAPAGAAFRLTARPYLGFTLSAAFAVAATWIGIGAATAIPSLPPSSAIVGAAVAIWLLAALSDLRFRLRKKRIRKFH